MLLTSIGKAVFCQKTFEARPKRVKHPTAPFRRWITNFLRSAFSKLKKLVSRRSSSISGVVCPDRNQTINRAAYDLPFFIEEPIVEDENLQRLDASRLELNSAPSYHAHVAIHIRFLFLLLHSRRDHLTIAQVEQARLFRGSKTKRRNESERAKKEQLSESVGEEKNSLRWW